MTEKQNIKIGTVLALLAPQRPLSNIPKISHNLYTVSRVTATQAVAVSSSQREIRVRLKDGYLVGDAYEHAVIATEEMQAQHKSQVSEWMRWHKANFSTKDLIGKELHQLKLTTDQLEALAKAWTEIKEMAPANQ